MDGDKQNGIEGKKFDKSQMLQKVLSPLLFYTNYNLKIWIPLKSDIEMANYLINQNFHIEKYYEGVNFLSTNVMIANYIFMIPPTNDLPKYIYKAFRLGIPFAILIPLYSLADEKIQHQLKNDGLQLLFLKNGYVFNTKNVPAVWLCYKMLSSPIKME